MQPLNLVSSGQDRELHAIRRTLEVFHTVSGLDELLAILRTQIERALILDLIGHSCSHGFLVIGDWKIDDSPQTAASFSEFFRPALERLGVRSIRLLGCATAVTPRGRSAIRKIAHATRCEVLGTARYIGHHDYSRRGFVRDDTLMRADGLPPSRGAMFGVIVPECTHPPRQG